MPKKSKVQGEGNYDASRKYNEATLQFVKSGRVPDAARAAAPRTPAEAAEMKQAEEIASRNASKSSPVPHEGDSEQKIEFEKQPAPERPRASRQSRS